VAGEEEMALCVALTVRGLRSCWEGGTTDRKDVRLGEQNQEPPAEGLPVLVGIASSMGRASRLVLLTSTLAYVSRTA
jgi:hypothetical protein